MNLITSTHRCVLVKAHTRLVKDKPNSTDALHESLRREVEFERELEAALAENMRGTVGA